MKVGYIQFKPVFGEKERNVRRLISFIHKNSEAELLVLPELCTTGYLFTSITELQAMGEKIPSGPTIRAFEKAAEETGTSLVVGLCEKASEKTFYNSAVLITPNGFAASYRKVHLFNTEKDFFLPGDGPLEVYSLENKTKIGIIICFDWVFPEITRVLALKGAEIICHPANLVLPYAQKAMLTRSVENRVFTITANRIGMDIKEKTSLHFTGRSQITSPQMALVVQSSETAEEVCMVDIDPSLARDKNITARNHLFEDRRTEFYRSLIQ